MNTFNRVIMIILLLVSLVFWTVTLIVPQMIVKWALLWLTYFDEMLSGANAFWLATAGIGLAILVDLILLIILWLEIRRPRLKGVRVQRIEGGEVELATDSISQRLAYYIDGLAGVNKVQPHVVSRGKTVDVVLDLETTHEVEDIPAKTEEVVQVATKVVEEQLGLKLNRIKVNLRHQPYPPR